MQGQFKKPAAKPQRGLSDATCHHSHNTGSSRGKHSKVQIQDDSTDYSHHASKSSRAVDRGERSYRDGRENEVPKRAPGDHQYMAAMAPPKAMKGMHDKSH